MPLPANAVLDTLKDTFTSFLPRLAAAIVVLLVGLFVIRLVMKTLGRLLAASGLDKIGERLGVAETFGKLGLGASLSDLIVRVMRIVFTIVVIIIAVSLLGVDSLSQTMNDALGFIPKLLIAIAILMVAVMLGNWARQRVERSAEQMDLKGPLGLLVEIAVIVTLGLVAAAQIGIPTEIMVVVVAVVLAGVALALALGFGLGAQGVIRQISAGRYLSGSFQPGTRVQVGDAAGEITSMDSTACSIRTDDGRTLRIPNSQLLDQIVTVSDPPPEATTPAAG